MLDDLFTREELTVIDRLRNAPQPELKPQAVASIRDLIFQELDKPTPPRHPARPIQPLLIATAIALVIVIVVVSILVIARHEPILVTPGTNNGPTMTSIPTVTATSEASPDSSILQPTFRPTPGETIAATSAATETIANDTVMVIEGPIQSIDANRITIFGMTVSIDPGDPVLAQLQVGKMIHVEGRLDVQHDTIIAVKVIIVSVSSPGLPPNCKMSKKGHIKCSKKKK